MFGLKVDIEHPGGQTETVQVEGDRLLIGSGAHCEIRLAQDQAAVEHVEVVALPGGGGLVATARSFQPAPRLNDVQFDRSPVTAGAVLSLGQTRLRISVAELDASVDVKKAKQQQSSPMTFILAALVIPIAGYVLLMDDSPAMAATIPEAPSLWGDAPGVCPQSTPTEALSSAGSKLALADAKDERRPFHVQDGVDAVTLFEDASACLKVGGNADSARQAAERAEEVKREVTLDYRTHRMRLEHALSIDDTRSAQREVRLLLAYTEKQHGPYVSWLRDLERKYSLMYGKEP